MIFRAPGLSDASQHGPGVMIVQVQCDGVSVVGPMDQGDVWFFGRGVGEAEQLSEAQALAAIRDTTGFDLPYEILGKDLWVASQLLASRYSDRRIVLAGDACHLHPPFGGYGMNMGVGDAVDLGWKIAATLQGWGGPALVVSDDADDAQVDSARAEAKGLGVPLAVVRPGEAIMRRYDAQLALIRPDQIVAWRGDRWIGALRRTIGRTSGTVGLSPETIRATQ